MALQVLKGPPSLGSFSSQVLTCGERETRVLAPPPVCDSVESPCLRVCLAFLHKHFPLLLPPSGPLGPSLQSTAELAWDCSPVSTQPLCVLEDLCPFLGYIGLLHRLFVWFLLHSDLHRSAASSPNSLKCLPFVPNYSSDAGISPLLQFLHPMGSGPVLLTLFLFFPSFLHPTKFCVNLCIPFWWSGTPASSQLVLCEILCF